MGHKISKTGLAAYQMALEQYAEQEDITAIDIGYKYQGGVAQNTLAVRIHVKKKRPKTELEATEIFPEFINNFPVDVIEASYAIKSALAGSRLKRFTTLMPGISVAHFNVSAGTLGAIVQDKTSKKQAILSNWHVLAGSEQAQVGDAILQPGPADGGSVGKDTIATLQKMILDKDGDAAIAVLNGKRKTNPSIYETNVLLSGIKEPSIGELLSKSGRTTGVTQGMVDGMGIYFINYPVGRRGIEGFKIVPQKSGNPDDEEISAGGDSGSIWYDAQSNRAVGLHFAGEATSVAEEEHALACYASRVFKRLDIELLASQEDTQPPTPDQPSHDVDQPVSDFTVYGFNDESISAHLLVEHQLQALELRVCVGAHYDEMAQAIRFSLPVYNQQYLIPYNKPILPHSTIKVCAQTCGGLIPCGIKGTLYIDQQPVLTLVFAGHA